MLTVRTPVRSAPRTHDATSAMSAVCMCTSSVAGRAFSETCDTTDGLYVWDSTELSPEIDP